MDKPNLKDLQDRFEEMKAEQEYIRFKFFEKLFTTIYKEEDPIHQRLKTEGSPNMVIIHPSLSEIIIEKSLIRIYCSVQTSPLIEENQMIFIWNKTQNANLQLLNISNQN